MAKKKFNKYVIDGDRVIIYLKNRLKETMECYIDLKNLQKFLDLGHSWHTYWNKVNNTYYARCSVYKGVVDGKPRYEMIYMHHFIKPIKEGEVVDHEDNNELNNCEDNLRVTSQDKNLMNRTTKNKNNKSGYRNVSWNKELKKWSVQLQINKRNTILGTFEDVHEAGEFAAEMRKKYYGEYQGNA
ncbi:AP2 domain-containing protein [Paenibacillus sophorae]|uniref:AP2 domain-containing protein n=1 Tax=Paenibacillus sophorae TaxID=1333845 RepID=A0A1H8GX87_9BACL|nr:HNH endonuclease [Paenibacillus sophorae]QWU14373.1 HNH endonuclease [Paenibacillus sophorae]SEN48682.1 AP2 domain-containing protein [Paenibacillus sophorae]